jgi:peptidoglycan/LPS O-acetylase OafA/YrhL
MSAVPLTDESAVRPESARPQPTVPARDSARGRRLAWLDALRGLAALAVVYAHFGGHVLPVVHNAAYSLFDPGLYGVLLFFLISGYIVPASLERKGSIRSFWVSRVFRLFPLFLVAVVIALSLHQFGWASLRGTQDNTAASVLAHVFMLSDVLGGADIIVVLWTLSYEMVFYLLITALFTAGLHQRSGRLAGFFAAAALLFGGLLPTIWLSNGPLGQTRVAVAADLLILGGLALAVAGRGPYRSAGAWLAAGTGLVLVTLNERANPYEGLTILAFMFTGTLIYRAEQGQVRRRTAAIAAAGVFAATVGAGFWHVATPLMQRQWVITLVLSAVTFAAGMAARNLRMPSFLTWLGVVSYSVYLLHPLILDIYDSIPFTQVSHPAGLQLAMTAAFLAAVLALSALTHHFVEVPGQRLGRRLTARLDARFGPDRLVPAGDGRAGRIRTMLAGEPSADLT